MKGSQAFFFFAAVIVAIDQASKWAVRNLLFGPIQLIGEFLQFTYVRNFGAGFGILQGQRILLSLVSLAVIVLIIHYYKKYAHDRFQKTAFTLILGGAVGNLIDRVFFGFVTDFITFSFFPSFNVADCCITIGACMLIYLEVSGMVRKKVSK